MPMDWFAALFDAACAYCGRAQGSCEAACEPCAGEATLLETARGVELELDGIPALALGEYEGWLRDVILHQKNARPTRPAVALFARLLRARMPESWRVLPLAWVPGSALSDAHLVERLALRLASLGQKLPRRAPLSRGILPALKTQKNLAEAERRQRDLGAAFFARAGLGLGREPQAGVILLDDVVTTGATLKACRRLLEERAGLRVAGALAIARTPRYWRVNASRVS